MHAFTVRQSGRRIALLDRPVGPAIPDSSAFQAHDAAASATMSVAHREDTVITRPLDDEPSEEILARIAVHAHQLGRAPYWVLAREIGVSVRDLFIYEARFPRPNPLRPWTTGPRSIAQVRHTAHSAGAVPPVTSTGVAASHGETAPHPE